MPKFLHNTTPPKPKAGKWLGNGWYRTVKVLKGNKDYVLKEERIDPGWPSANEREVKNWLRAPDDIRGHLAPIVAWADDYSWLVMVKVDKIAWQLGRNEYMMASRQLEPVWSRLELEDEHQSNWGLLGEKPVIIDYAQ